MDFENFILPEFKKKFRYDERKYNLSSSIR